MEPLFDRIARYSREMECSPRYVSVTRYVKVVLWWLLVLLFAGVAACAWVDARQKHTGVEFPAGRGFAACVFFGFSALFAYNVFAGLKRGVVTFGRNGSITIRRETDTFVFYLALAGITAVSLWLFYQGVWSMFAT